MLFKVSFQHSENVFCSNIAIAECAEDVEKHYNNYTWFSITEATAEDVEQAKYKGMPVITIEHETEQAEDAEEKGETHMFENLKREFIADQQEQKEAIASYIQNGYMPTWAAEHRTDADRGLKQYSTETRWTQYAAGKISREKAIEYAVKRYNKKKDAETAAKLAHLDRIANAEDANNISVYVNWKRSTVWGYNPTATVYTDAGKTTGKASGCGYDKESAAIAEAFNAQDAILKILYTIKENALAAGVSDRSATACTGRNNTECCGYGAGYSVLPYFEGGVGSNCFWKILEKVGFSVRYHSTKHSDTYTLYR